MKKFKMIMKIKIIKIKIMMMGLLKKNRPNLKLKMMNQIKKLIKMNLLKVILNFKE